MPSDLAARFWSKVDKNGPIVRPELGPCWLWTAGLKEGRYGVIQMAGRGERAHRVAFFLEYGRWPVPSCLHKCDVGLCVRFEHLYEGDQKQNVADSWQRGRANNLPGRIASAELRRAKRICVNGHEYTEANTYIRSTGHRGCKQCRKEAVRKWRQTSISR